MAKRGGFNAVLGLARCAAVGIGVLGFSVPASAEHIVWTCPKLPSESEFATLKFDPTIFGIDSDVDDGGKHFEIEYKLYAIVRQHDDSKPNWKEPEVCRFEKFWKAKLPLFNFFREFFEYPVAQHFTIENVPRHSVVNLRLLVTEDDDFRDDWADFNAYPDGSGQVIIDAYINRWKFQTMIGKRKQQFDITPGRAKRLTGDGKMDWSGHTFRAMIEFVLNGDVQKVADDRSPGLPSPGQPVNPPPPHPDDRPGCRDYAMKSVAQNQEAHKLGCGFQPPIWSNNHKAHFEWCVRGNNEKTVAGHIQARKTQLDACRKAKAPAPPKQPPGTDPAVAMCELYANEAIKIAAKASALQCPGLFGGRWVQDYKTHYDWCIANPHPGLLLAEAAARDAAYKACGGK